MIVRQIFDAASSTYTYLLGDEASGLAVIIDPVIGNIARYVALLAEHGLSLHLSLDTHTHADHVTAQARLRDLTGCRILVSRQSQVDCGCATFDDTRMLHVGDLGLMPIHTPGHTPDSYTFFALIEGRPTLFTGDTLLIGSTGRTDFQGGSAAQQYDSLFGKLLYFADDTLVYPAHDYHRRHVSTIGAERQSNPRLQVSGKDEYIETMGRLNLPPPKMLRLALAANRRCGHSRPAPASLHRGPAALT